MVGLDAAQDEFVRSLIGPYALVADHSWQEQTSRVLHVTVRGTSFIVKAGPQGNHHIGREIDAHGAWTTTLVHLDRTAPVVGWSQEANVLVVRYQPGELSAGTTHELSPDFHRQAGRVLSAFHSEACRVDDNHERRATARTLAWLETPHRISADAEARAREILGGLEPAPVLVVPTHGDWQPRNWLADGSWLRVIDFGRFAFRPASTDLCRLATQQWRGHPELEDAFLDGYGSDPRDQARWPAELLREAVGTTAWAFQTGNEAFEAHGHECLTRALALFSTR